MYTCKRTDYWDSVNMSLSSLPFDSIPAANMQEDGFICGECLHLVLTSRCIHSRKIL